LAAKIHRGGVRVDVASGADVHRIALREYPRVTALVRLSDVEEEELRFQERHVLAAESVLVRADPLEATDEARLTGDEARRPGGEWPCGHPSGRSSADDDRVVHSTMERGSELFRPYAVASAGNRTARSSPCAVGRYTYGGTPRRTAGPRCFVISWTAIRTRRP